MQDPSRQSISISIGPATSHRVACIVKSSLKTIYPSALPGYPSQTQLDGPSIAIDALNYLADTQEFGIEALRSHATELFGSCRASVALDQAGYIIYSYSEPDAVTKMDDIFYPSIYSLPDSGDLIGSCIDALYDPYIPRGRRGYERCA